MDISIFKQINTQQSGIYQLFFSITKDSVEVILLQNDLAWKSLMINKILEHFANEHKITLHDYYQSLESYIKDDNPNISFNVNNDEFTIIKKIKESLLVKYFTCKLMKVSHSENVYTIINKLYNQNNKLEEKVKILEKENVDTKKQKDQYEIKLKQLIVEKKEIETKQQSQFLLILNEKKRKIQHLTELLEAFNFGSLPHQHKQQIRNKSAVNKLETISNSASSESEEISTSDDEKVKEKVEPSTSFDFLEEDTPHESILPKRAKFSNSNVAEVVIPQEEKPQNMQQSSKRDKSPTVDFSTQQLLDMF